MFTHLTIEADSPAKSFAVAGLALFMAAVIWFGLRPKPAGMEIQDGQWRFFRGHRRWTIPLSQIAQVRVLKGADAPSLLALELRAGRIEFLPPEIRPDLAELRQELARYGIPLRD